jgi:hypothetical protein
VQRVYTTASRKADIGVGYAIAAAELTEPTVATRVSTTILANTIADGAAVPVLIRAVLRLRAIRIVFANQGDGGLFSVLGGRRAVRCAPKPRRKYAKYGA